MQLQMAQELVRTDPAAAEDLIGKLGTAAKSVIEDLRRLVDGLGPCALDQLGLVPAISQRVSCIASLRSEAGSAGTLKVAVEATGHLEGLPAAIEVAAYHIVSEAVHAVCRHGIATHCEVRLRRGESGLTIEVTEDGCGLREEGRPEAAVSRMRVRAGELGGTVSVASTPGGTLVRARLPLPEM
jgi:signal transduction histidine kinase